MRLRKHQHQWELIGARYNPPSSRVLSVENVTPEAMAEVLHGFTLLTQRCTGCEWIEVTRTPGKPDFSQLGLSWTTKEAVS